MDSGKRAAPVRKAAPYVAFYLLAALAIPLFFSAGRFRPFPQVEVYSGDLRFSGAKAFADLQTFTEQYPARYPGTRGSRLSAGWVQEQLLSLGLNAQMEEFDCIIRDTAISNAEASSYPVGDLTYRAKGYNVVAVSPGESQETVIIGAHRDMMGNGTGAEDDGSGTVAVIELARALTGEEHYYTYVFASWDGEEAGLRGSEAYAAAHMGDQIKVALALDMVGFNKADTLGFLPFVSSKGASAFWTAALARDVAVARDMPLFYYGTLGRDAGSPIVSFWQMRSERLSGRIPTDSGPFIDRSIPAVGLIAAQSLGSPGEGRIASIHSLDDTIAQVSPATLDASGRFVEQYVRSLELNHFGGAMNGHLYFISDDKALMPQTMGLFTAYVSALALALGFLTWRDSRVSVAAFLGFLRSEWVWLVSLIGVTLLAATFPVIATTSLFRRLSLVPLHVIWAALTLSGLGAIAYFRNRALGKQDVSYHEVTGRQKLMLNVAYTLAFFVLLAATNVFLAFSCTAFPILFLGRVNFRSEDSRVLFLVATVVWLVFCVLNLRGNIVAAIFYPSTLKSVLVDSVRMGIWTLTAVYLFTAPRRGTLAPAPDKT